MSMVKIHEKPWVTNVGVTYTSCTSLIKTSVKMTKNIWKSLLRLLTTYKSTEYCTPVDFVTEQLEKQDLSVEDVEVNQFIKLMKHEEFLNEVAEEFIRSNKSTKYNRTTLIVLIYFIIFLLDETNFQNILHPSMYHLKSVMHFLSSEEHYEKITKTASSFFDSEYVVNNIIHPLLNKAQVLRRLAKYIENREKSKIPKRPLTRVVEFKSMTAHRRIPPPPSNTPIIDSEPLSRKPVPKTNYIPDLRVQESIKKDHHRNLIKAKNLLIEAMEMPQHLTQPREFPKTVEPEPTAIKARKVPPTLRRAVETKGNITTTLREAAHLMKEQENEITRIEEIIRGGFNMQRIQEIEQEERQNAERKAIEDIQKKHLQGLITFEEAILAKKKLLEANKMKTLEMKAAKLELAEKLDKWKQDEEEKVKAQVERCQKSKIEAKEAEMKLLEKKQTEVRLQQYETKELLRKAEEEKGRELARKMELIQEIKTLHEITIKMNEAKREFDPTEASNLGLLCEMSIAELNERLVIAKMAMKQELEEKRRCILAKKNEQREMVENVRNFIAQARQMSKPTSMPILTPELEQSADLVELRKRLEEKRNLRMKT